MVSGLTTLCRVTSEGARLWAGLIIPLSLVAFGSQCKGGTPWDCRLYMLVYVLALSCSGFCLCHTIDFLVFWLLSTSSFMTFSEPLMPLWTWVHTCASVCLWHADLEPCGCTLKGDTAVSYGCSISSFSHESPEQFPQWLHKFKFPPTMIRASPPNSQ